MEHKSIFKIIKVFIALITVFLFTDEFVFGQVSHRDSLYIYGIANYLSHNDVDSAIKSAKELDDKNPANQKLLLLGILYEMKPDPKTADSYFQKAIAIPDSDTAEIYSILSAVYINRKDTSTAKNYLAASVQHNDKMPDRMFLLGNIYSALHNPDSAGIYFQKAYDLNDTVARYAQSLFASYRSKGMVAGSMPYLKKWTVDDSTSIPARLTLIQQWMELDSFSKAKPLNDSLHRPLRYLDTVLYYRAVCLLELGDTIKGFHELRCAINTSPLPNPVYYRRLVSVYEAKGMVDDMVTTIRNGASKGIAADSIWLAAFELSLAESARLDSLLAHDDEAGQLRDLILLATQSTFQKNHFETLNLLNQYAIAGGNLTDTFYCLKAGAELGLNRLTQARLDIETAQRLAPNNPNYVPMQIAILYQSKSYQALVDLISPMDPMNMPTVGFTAEDRSDMLFRCYTVLGEMPKAIKFYTRK